MQFALNTMQSIRGGAARPIDIAMDNRERDGNPVFQANLDALREAYPALAARLASISPAPGESRPEASAGGPLNLKPGMHVADRFADAPVVIRLFEEMQLQSLTDNAERRLLLLEDRLDVLRRALGERDWRPAVRSPLCLWCVDADGLEGLRKLLAAHPEIAWSSAVRHETPASNAERAAEIGRLLKEAGRRVARSLDHLVQSNTGRRPPPYPREIRFFAPGHNYLQDAAARALRELGYGAKRIEWKAPLYRFIRAAAWRREYAEAPFDLAVFLNATPAVSGVAHHFSRLPVRSAAWFVDNPRRFRVPPAPGAPEGCDVVGVFDPVYLDMAERLTGAKGVVVPTGYGADPGAAAPDGDFAAIDIAFVGELGVNGFLSAEEGFRRRRPEVSELVDSILMEEDISQPVFLDPIAERRFSERGLEYRGHAAAYLENKAACLRRRHYLEALAGMNLRIFGDSAWGRPLYAGEAAKRYAGTGLDYRAELPRLYASAKINLNIFHPQCVRGLNPRVYDTLACGGFLLSTPNPGLAEEFAIGEDLDVFHNRGELLEKVNHYLTRPALRREMADSGRRRALARCGYAGRMQRLLAALSPSLSGESNADLR